MKCRNYTKYAVDIEQNYTHIHTNMVELSL